MKSVLYIMIPNFIYRSSLHASLFFRTYSSLSLLFSLVTGLHQDYGAGRKTDHDFFFVFRNLVADAQAIVRRKRCLLYTSCLCNLAVYIILLKNDVFTITLMATIIISE